MNDSPSAQQVISEVLRVHRIVYLDQFICVKCRETFTSDQDMRAHQAAQIDAALGGLNRQERWVPIDATGQGWAPREKPLAMAALASYCAHGPLHFAGTVPLTHVVGETCWLSGWQEFADA